MNIRDIQPILEEFTFVAQAHRMGVFASLAEKPDTAEGLARRMKFDNRASELLLEALVELKYLRKTNGCFSVTASVKKRLVDAENPHYEGHFWQFLYYLQNPWRTLAHVMREGRPDKRSFRELSMVDFIRGMDSPWKKEVSSEIVDVCLRHCGHAKSAVDIGGAPGTIAREFASRKIKTVVFDLPVSMEITREELSRVKNISVVEGDATRSLPDGTFDIAFLGNLCHGQSPEDNAAIIQRCYEHLNAPGIVVVFDNLKGENPGAAVLALHMLTQSPLGNIYARKEYMAWLKQAGFKKITVEKLADPSWSIVIGHKLR